MRLKNNLFLFVGTVGGAFLFLLFVLTENNFFVPVKNLPDIEGVNDVSRSSTTNWAKNIPKFTDHQPVANKPGLNSVIQDEVELMPVEWEEPFLEIMTKNGQSMDERNALLIDFAINKSVGVPQVQEECLRHLAYGLRSNQKEEFYKIMTTSNIPIEIRKRFLGHVFDMDRNDEFIAALCRQLRLYGNAELISFSKSRVQNFDEL